MSNSKIFEIVFDDRSHMWNSDSIFNKLLVKVQLGFLLDKFDASGFLFVKDIYEQFAIPFTKESITAGWHKNECRRIIVESIQYYDDHITMRFVANEDIRGYF